MFLNSTVQKSSILKLLISLLTLILCSYRGCKLVALATLPLFTSLKCHWLAGWGWFKCLLRFIVTNVFLVVSNGLLWRILSLHSQCNTSTLKKCLCVPQVCTKLFDSIMHVAHLLMHRIINALLASKEFKNSIPYTQLGQQCQYMINIFLNRCIVVLEKL